jgi:hypothetical protein
MDSLHINQTSTARVFECPKCRETINTSVSQCPFCSAPIEPAVADAAAEFMSRVNQACSDASYLRIMGGLMVTFAVLTGLHLPLVGYVFFFLLFAVPVMAIRWQVRFRGIQTGDADFLAAKRAWKVTCGLWAASLVALGVIGGLVDALFSGAYR